jgi:DNA-directed RNA polymerase specialized sigma24 family protein
MTGDPTDPELLRRYLADDGADTAFAALVERHLPVVYGAAFRQLNDPSLAREVTQNVFIMLARRAVWLTGHPSLAGWLYRTAIHLAQHEARGEQRRRHRAGRKFDSGVAYRIPNLTAEVEAIRQTFSQQLNQTLGSSRAQLLEQAADSHIRQNLDDLGAGERTIGFIWQIENDGTRSVIYGIADAQHGGSSFQRIPDNLDPNSQIAYYARTFGVELPGQH